MADNREHSREAVILEIQAVVIQEIQDMEILDQDMAEITMQPDQAMAEITLSRVMAALATAMAETIMAIMARDHPTATQMDSATTDTI
jgi:hypothetical protein